MSVQNICYVLGIYCYNYYLNTFNYYFHAKQSPLQPTYSISMFGYCCGICVLPHISIQTLQYIQKLSDRYIARQREIARERETSERGSRGKWRVFRLGSAYFRHYPLNIYENCFCCSFIHFAVVLKFSSLALHAVLFIFFGGTVWFIFLEGEQGQ